MKLFVIDDHPIILSGLADLVRKHFTWDIQEITSTAHLVATLREHDAPDLIITDVNMPGGCIFETLRKFIVNRYTPRIIVYTAFVTDLVIRRAIGVGAAGILSKGDSYENLIECLRIVSCHGTFYSESVRDRLLQSTVYEVAPKPDVRISSLSARELEVLRCVGGGQSNAMIAETLKISIKTVNRHKGSIMAKLSIRSSAEMMKYALRHGIAELSE